MESQDQSLPSSQRQTVSHIPNHKCLQDKMSYKLFHMPLSIIYECAMWTIMKSVQF
jgi:hypothetical protein